MNCYSLEIDNNINNNNNNNDSDNKHFDLYLDIALRFQDIISSFFLNFIQLFCSFYHFCDVLKNVHQQKIVDALNGMKMMD